MTTTPTIGDVAAPGPFVTSRRSSVCPDYGKTSGREVALGAPMGLSLDMAPDKEAVSALFRRHLRLTRSEQTSISLSNREAGTSLHFAIGLKAKECVRDERQRRA